MISTPVLNTCVCALYIIATVFGVFFPNIAMVFLILKIISCLLLYVLNCKKIDKIQNVLLLLTIALMVFSGFWNGDEIKSIILPCHFVLMMILIRFVNVKPVLEKFIVFSCGILFVYFASLSITVWADYLKGSASINPNSLAKYLVVLSIVIMTSIGRGTKHSLIWRTAFGALSFYFIFLTSCRSAIIAYALYIIVILIPVLRNFIFRHRKIIAITIMIIGSIFPMVYVDMYKNGSFSGDSEYFGKDVYTGRQVLWPKLFEQISNDPSSVFTGYGTEIDVYTQDISNYHSWYFGVFLSFGVVVAVLYFLEYIKSTMRISDKSLVVGFLSLMIIGITEMLTLWEITQSLVITLFMYAFSAQNSSKKCVDGGIL